MEMRGVKVKTRYICEPLEIYLFLAYGGLIDKSFLISYFLRLIVSEVKRNGEPSTWCLGGASERRTTKRADKTSRFNRDKVLEKK